MYDTNVVFSLVAGDDVVSVQDKVNHVKDRYSALDTKCGERLGQMEQALPLAQNFFDTHEKLLDWLQHIEPDLRAKEATGPEAEKQLEELQRKVDECRPLLDVLNQDGPHLAMLSPGEGSSRVDDMLTKDNKKFDAIDEQVKKRADKLNLQKQKSMELLNDIDDLLDWFKDTERQIEEAEPVSSEVDELRKQLVEQKTLNDDINSQKSKARDVISAGKRLRRESSSIDDDPVIRDKMDELKQQGDAVAKLSADRLSTLEQALPLAQHFQDTHEELQKWFDVVEREIEEQDPPAINTEQLKEQQDAAKVLKQNIADNKPLQDRLNKTGSALLKLVGEEDQDKVQDILDQDNARFDAVKDGVRERNNVIEESIQQTSEVSLRLELEIAKARQFVMPHH